MVRAAHVPARHPRTERASASSSVRRWVVILGDQLDDQSPVFGDFDPAQDQIWMAEVAGESTKIWSHRARIAMFLAAMRQFRNRLRARGFMVRYRTLDDPKNRGSLAAELAATLAEARPTEVWMVEAGEWSVQEEVRRTVESAGLPLKVVEDTHFYCSRARFQRHAAGRKQLRMEFFYREMRQEHGVLMRSDGEPEGGAWNFDAENRESFGKEGPGFVPPSIGFEPDPETQAVLDLVMKRFPDHPGSVARFNWPVSREQALLALNDFIDHRLPQFGQFQDAMWSGEPWLYHSRISAALNLKLLNPREVVQAAQKAYRSGACELASVEGFIRQILGWREYVRGVYWQFMPEYLDRNALQAAEPLPRFYWTGETPMNCLRHVLTQTLEYGYAHHIQRLMVTGLFSLLLGVHPRQVHEWYLAVYVDALEWVELPNTLGMSQYADGGVMASKPYIASGKYIQRMSNYCAGCQFDPSQSTGKQACPFTTFYWDFLIRHETLLSKNPRMGMQVRNLRRLTPRQLDAIRDTAADWRKRFREGSNPKV